MHVDEAGSHDEATGIDFTPGLSFRHSSDGDEPISPDGHVADKPRIAAAIDNFAVADHQVVSRLGGK